MKRFIIVSAIFSCLLVVFSFVSCSSFNSSPKELTSIKNAYKDYLLENTDTSKIMSKSIEEIQTSKVVISTIQRLFSAITGQTLTTENDDDEKCEQKLLTDFRNAPSILYRLEHITSPLLSRQPFRFFRYLPPSGRFRWPPPPSFPNETG